MLVIVFLPRSKHILISWLQSPSAVILEPKKIKSVTVFLVSSSICHVETRCHGLSFLNVEFSVSYFRFIRTLFRSSSLSTIKVVSSAYPWLLVFLPAILIPICGLSSLAFFRIYSAYKLNEQGYNMPP